MILWLPSFPRSGNTFFRILLHHVYRLPTYSGFLSGDDLSWVGASDVTGHDTLPRELQRALVRGDREALAPFQESKKIYPIKTHQMARETLIPELPAILLVRDVRDVMVSFAWYMINVQPIQARAEPLSELLRRPRANLAALRARLTGRLRDMGLKDWLFRFHLRLLARMPRWSELNSGWMDRSPGRPPVVVRFEDLVARPIETVREALAGVSADVTPVASEFPTFEELQRIFPAFFREGKSGTGRQCYPDRLHAQLLTVHGAAMRRFGYL